VGWLVRFAVWIWLLGYEGHFDKRFLDVCGEGSRGSLGSETIWPFEAIRVEILRQSFLQIWCIAREVWPGRCDGPLAFASVAAIAMELLIHIRDTTESFVRPHFGSKKNLLAICEREQNDIF